MGRNALLEDRASLIKLRAQCRELEKSGSTKDTVDCELQQVTKAATSELEDASMTLEGVKEFVRQNPAVYAARYTVIHTTVAHCSAFQRRRMSERACMKKKSVGYRRQIRR